MHLIIKEAMQKIDLHNVDYKDKCKAFEILVAEIIAANLELPTSPVTELHAYFSAHCKVNVLTKLAEVNENTVIDIDRASDLVFKIWTLRYSLVHRMNDISTGRFLMHAMVSESIKMPECYRRVLDKHPTMYFSRYVIKDAKEYMDGV